MAFKLSKSIFMKGVQCPKAIWLHMKRRELSSPITPEQESIFEQGRQVGDLAKNLYPNGVEIPFNTKPFSEKFRLTAQYVQEKKTIYEATFQSDTMMCMVDILHYGDEGWELIEVKSSTSAKDETIIDIALQYHVVTSSGLPINKVRLVHINADYVRGSTLDLNQYFTQVDLTDTIIQKQTEIIGLKAKFSQLLNNYQEPEQAIGPHCTRPYTCSFKDYCWQHLPDYSVFDLVGMKQDEKFELYYKGYLSIFDIPDTSQLKPHIAQQIDIEKTKETVIDKDGIQDFLKTLHYPLAFFDFESFSSAIPPYRMTRAYKQIPFQYSLHIMNSPFDVPSHFEYLGTGTEDPREALIKKMVKDIPKDACILVYNEQFEKMVIQDLISAFPKYESELQRIHDQIKDLMLPFKNRYLYTHTMQGRYSIKKVLPALVPELSYENLDIQEGLTASLTYTKLHTLAPNERDTVRQQLLDYCQLDTFAMIKLLESLKKS